MELERKVLQCVRSQAKQARGVLEICEIAPGNYPKVWHEECDHQEDQSQNQHLLKVTAKSAYDDFNRPST